MTQLSRSDYQGLCSFPEPVLRSFARELIRLYEGGAPLWLRAAYDKSARLHALQRRWAADSKPCNRCGTRVLWRVEQGRRRPINEKGEVHGCE